jgi:hypothetical protein
VAACPKRTMTLMAHHRTQQGSQQQQQQQEEAHSCPSALGWPSQVYHSSPGNLLLLLLGVQQASSATYQQQQQQQAPGVCHMQLHPCLPPRPSTTKLRQPLTCSQSCQDQQQQQQLEVGRLQRGQL